MKAGDQDFPVAQALWTLLTAVSGLNDEHERARLLATGLPALLPCPVSGLALLNQAGTGWSLALQKDGRQLDSPQAEEILADLEPFLQEAFRRPALLIAASDNESEIGRIPPPLKKLGVRVKAVVPLMTLHSRIGVLFAGREDPEAFSQQDMFVLLTLAEHSALGIENLRLSHMQKRYTEKLQDLVNERTEALRKSEERHRVLLEINNAIIAHLDRAPLFNAIAESLHKALPFDRASLTLLDPAKDSLRVYALAGFKEPRQVFPVGSEFPRKSSHLASVFEHKRPLLRRDLEKDQRRGPEDLLFKEGIRAYVSVPLMAKQEAFGSLNVGSLTPDAYSQADADFLMEVGQQVTLAIENTFAYEEIAQLKARLEQENVYLQEEISTEVGSTDLVGQSLPLRNVLRQIDMVAPTDASVLILGETGTGKELIARAIHHLSPRGSRPLIKVNCAALPAGLVESELFGHEKGAFTGALQKKIGRFELAHEGTIFLDEVGDVPPETQVKLLRVLQEQEFERVGGTQTIRVDVRVIAATNRDLEAAVAQKTFRADLFYRLNVFPVRLPPLRERTQDIPVLVGYFIGKNAKKMDKRIEGVSQATLDRLIQYPWPGNVRELENVIERAMIRCQRSVLDIAEEELFTPRSAAVQPDRLRSLEEMERDYILKVLKLTGWAIGGKAGAAQILEMHPNTLRSRMLKLGIKKPD